MGAQHLRIVLANNLNRMVHVCVYRMVPLVFIEEGEPLVVGGSIHPNELVPVWSPSAYPTEHRPGPGFGQMTAMT